MTVFWNFQREEHVDILSGKTILVTGGTGSFGSTFAKYALSSGAANVRVLSRDEAKQDLMRQELADDRLDFYIGDTREVDSVRRAVRGAEIIFHAAALKQVPSAEFFPIEAVRTNILGSKNVLDAAYEFGVRNAVFLSTDKAVYPINAMGQSKALMEKTVLSYAQAVEVNEIGFRHGEKLYETLLSSEELPFCRDLGDYFVVPIDDRDLNYANYFSVGQKRTEDIASSYNSHNTKRLDLAETVEALLSVREIRERLQRD
jgi:FlaA1/EpsC-like NDP-sugar epimerase